MDSIGGTRVGGQPSNPGNKPQKFNNRFFNLRTAERVKSHNILTDLLLSDQSVALGLNTLRPTLTESLVLGTLSVHLLLEGTLALALSLGLLDL